MSLSKIQPADYVGFQIWRGSAYLGRVESVFTDGDGVVWLKSTLGNHYSTFDVESSDLIDSIELFPLED